MADNLFPPNQLGTTSVVYNPMRSDLDANQYKITDLPAPTAGTDAANKNYVDASVGPGGGAANWANNPAVNNVNMNGFGINSATTIVASGDITASGNSLITTAGQVATNTTAIAANTAAIATKAPLASPTFTGTVTVPNPPANSNCAVNQTYVDNAIAAVSAADWSQYPATQTVNLDGNTLSNAGVINFNNAGDLSALLGLTLNAGGAANISAGLNASLYAAGTVSIGGPINHFTVDGNDITGVDGLGANTVNAASVNATTVSASGNITGNNVAATATVQGASVVASGTVQGAAVSCSGTITGNTITSIGAINAASASITGNVAAATVNASGVINGASVNATSGNLHALNGSVYASGTGLGQGIVEGAVKAVAPLGDFNTVFTGEIQLGDNAGVNELTLLSNEPTSHVITAIEEGGTGTPGGVVDTRINPITASLSGSTLNIGAKNGAGAATNMASVNLSSLTPDPLFTQFLSLSSPGGSTYNLAANQVNAAIDFEVSSTGSCTVNLPNGVAAGSAIFIKLNSESTANFTNIFLTPPGVAVGSPPSVNIKPGGGCFCIAMNSLGGDTQWAISESFGYVAALADYVPLAGTAPGAPMTGTLQVADTTNIEAKNITTALLTPLPSIGYISALGPMQVENGNFLVANGTATEIGLAATPNPPVGEVATITYNYAASDNLIFNKRLEAPNMTLGSTDVLPTLNFKDAQTFYVSKQGNDANSGAINAPFLTIQAAVNAAVATVNEAIVQIGPGVFTENINIASVAGIMLQGCVQSDRNIEGTNINGTITIAVVADNLNNNQIVLSGLAIAPGRIVDTSTGQHTLIIESCRLEGEADTGGVAVNINMTATDGRTFINNCTMTQEAGTTGNTAMISVNVGWLNIQNTNITVRAEGNAIHMSGSSLLVRMANCALESSSASATPNALLFLNSSNASPHNIALTSFAIPSTTSKTTPAILATRPTAGIMTALVANCLFGIAGTLATGNVIAYGAGTALVLLVAGNRSLNTSAAAYSSAIQTGATVLPLSYVGETRVNTINNLSGNLTIAGAGTVSVSQSGSTITITGSGGSGGITEILGGSGISVANGTGPTATITNTGILGITAADSSVTVTSGQNPTVGLPNQSITPGAYQWAALSVDQKGVITAISENSVPFTSLTAGDAISISAGSGSATITNTGVKSISPGSGIQVSSATGDVVISATGSAGGAVLYLNPSVASDIPTYYSMSTSLLSSPEQTLTASSSGSTPALVAAFATPSGYPNATQIDGGIWNYTLYASVDNLSSTSILSAQIYKRSSAGTETLLSTSDNSVNINSLTPVPVNLFFNDVFQPETILATDRIVVKINFTHTGGSATTCTLYSEGASHYSYIQTTINAVVGTPVQSVSGGVGISISGTATSPVVNNDGVLSVGVNSTLVNTGTAQDPVLGIATTGTITTEVIDVNRVQATGTGVDYSTFGTYPRVSGTYVPPTDPLQLAPVQYVNDNAGVQSVTAGDASITIGNTAADPTVAVAASGVVAGAYTNASITVLADGRVSVASSGTAPVTAVSGTSGQIASTGGATPVLSLVNTTVSPGSYTNASLTVDSTGRLTAASSGATPVTAVSGTAGQITSTGGATPVLALATAGTAGTYTYVSALQTDSFGRVISATSGTNPATQFLALAGGTMTGGINMGGQAIANAGTITATTTNTTALSLPNAGAGGTAFITALQTDTNAAPTNNLFITQTSGALSLFKPLANPVILYSAGASANLFTYLVPQFYGERHVYTGSAVSPVLNYNTSNNYTVGGNSISLNPFYVELTNGSSSALTVKVRYPNGGIPPAQYPPVSTAPTTVAPAGTWADQSILPVGLTPTTTPTIASGATKRLFFNGTNWYLI